MGQGQNYKDGIECRGKFKDCSKEPKEQEISYEKENNITTDNMV